MKSYGGTIAHYMEKNKQSTNITKVVFLNEYNGF